MMNMRDKFNDRRRRGNGFTLVELMVTVSILVILLAVGVPEMRLFIISRQVTSDAERLAMSLQLAKTEALKRSGQVSVCPLPINLQDAEAATCADAATRDWSNGWMVFIDASDPPDGTPYVADQDTPILIERGSRTRAIDYSINRRVLQFQGNGLLNNQPGTFIVGTQGNTAGRLCKALTLNRQGRIASSACPAQD